MKTGVIAGVLLGLVLILAQPFNPAEGLLPELSSYLTTIPLWVAALLFHRNATPVAEGGLVLIYFLAAGLLLGVAFERKRVFGWLLFVMLIVCHYVVYEQFNRQMGEVLQSFLNLFS